MSIKSLVSSFNNRHKKNVQYQFYVISLSFLLKAYELDALHKEFIAEDRNLLKVMQICFKITYMLSLK